METLIHADVFFFVTTIALILVSVGLIVALVYVIKILRDFSEVSRKVKEEGIEILNDVKTLRGDIKKEGFRMGRAIKLFSFLLKKRKGAKNKADESE